jgi:hypothetical protein
MPSDGHSRMMAPRYGVMKSSAQCGRKVACQDVRFDDPGAQDGCGRSYRIESVTALCGSDLHQRWYDSPGILGKLRLSRVPTI